METTKHREGTTAWVGWKKATVTPEMQIAAEVAVQLRISPKYTDDGAPEGTCEKPVSLSPQKARAPALPSQDPAVNFETPGSRGPEKRHETPPPSQDPELDTYQMIP